uniref:Reverse transcriptase n=1 Tax=Schistosoma curassoni TaxID=6186 RepID=A0A183KPZ9_9TREM
MKHSVDAQLRDRQAGFRKDRSCTDQATPRIIMEQSIEWNSSLYINSID